MGQANNRNIPEMVLSYAKSFLIKHEGVREKPYDDATGETVMPGTTVEGKVTIGVGRNLIDNPLSQVEIEFLLNRDMVVAIMDCRRLFLNFDSIDPIRQAVLIDMAFNLGRSRLGGFKLMRMYVDARNYEKAAEEMLDSKWARRVKGRATFLAKVMRTGRASTD